MALDVVDLREFYDSLLGALVRRYLRRLVTALWPDLRGQTVVALGYGTPVLRPWLEKAGRVLALMPDAQGVSYWPREGENVSCLVSMTQLPLQNESVDRIILMHGLETAQDPESVLEEVWRILKANGQAIIIVPNRRGIWARSDHTPFGTGQPYSTSQLKRLLRGQGFCVERTAHALFMPPWTGRLAMVLSDWVEAVGAAFLPAFGGVLVMQAGKQVLTPAMVTRKRITRRMVVPLPFPSSPVPTGRNTQ